jgi:hypothetical protein
VRGQKGERELLEKRLGRVSSRRNDHWHMYQKPQPTAALLTHPDFDSSSDRMGRPGGLCVLTKMSENLSRRIN